MAFSAFLLHRRETHTHIYIYIYTHTDAETTIIMWCFYFRRLPAWKLVPITYIPIAVSALADMQNENHHADYKRYQMEEALRCYSVHAVYSIIKQFLIPRPSSIVIHRASSCRRISLYSVNAVTGSGNACRVRDMPATYRR